MSKSGKKRKSYFGAGFSQASFERPASQTKPPKSILIVTEGQVTEPVYLRALAAHWGLHPHVTTIKPGGEGIPANLVTTALAVREQRATDDKAGKLPFNQVGSFDETWIVFDTEHAARQGRLDDGIRLAKSHGIQIAHSTLCFEFWLVLHYALKARPMDTCKQTCSLLEEVAGLKKRSYSKTNGATTEFIDKLICQVSSAVRNADLLAKQQAGEPIPVNPSTLMPSLVRTLHDALPEEIRKRFPLLKPYP